MEMAIECLAGYLRSCKTDGETIPTPSSLTDVEACAKEHFDKSEIRYAS